MMKVLHLSETLGWSGGAAQLLALANGLRGRGSQACLACPPGGDLWRRAESEGVLLFPFTPFQDYDLLSAWKIARLARELKVDLIHAHHPRAHAVGLVAKLLSGGRAPKLVVTRRVSFPIGRNPFSRWKYRSASLDGFIAVAESIRERLIADGVAPAKIVTIPSGTDLSEFSPRPPDAEMAAELGLAEDAPVVGLVGHYGSWKGHEIFIKAAGELKRRRARAVFVVAGRSTDSPELAELARREGLESKDVRFLGPRRDIPRLLSCLSVSVNAATSGEGISGALRESLAMGVPVVASRVGGNAELVREGRTGETFPPGDWSALADAIQALLKDRDRALRLANEGRRYVQENLTTERMVERTLDFYGRLIGGGGARPPASAPTA